MTPIRTTEDLQRAVRANRVLAAFGAVDTCRRGWKARLRRELDDGGARLWAQLVASFPGAQPWETLLNAWVLAGDGTLRLAALAVAVRSQPGTDAPWRAARRRLQATVRARIGPRTRWLRATLGTIELADLAAPSPALGARVALRHALAQCLVAGQPPLGWLSLHPLHLRVSPEGYRLELTRAVAHARRLGLDLRLRADEIASLDPWQAGLLTPPGPVADAFVGTAGGNAAPSATRAAAHAPATDPLRHRLRRLGQFLTAIRHRDLAEAERLLAAAPIAPPAGPVPDDLRARARRAIEHPVGWASRQPWAPLSAASRALLGALAGGPVPDWLSMDRAAVVGHLAAHGTLPGMPATDVARFRGPGLSSTERIALLAAGRLALAEPWPGQPDAHEARAMIDAAAALAPGDRFVRHLRQAARESEPVRAAIVQAATAGHPPAAIADLFAHLVPGRICAADLLRLRPAPLVESMLTAPALAASDALLAGVVAACRRRAADRPADADALLERCVDAAFLGLDALRGRHVDFDERLDWITTGLTPIAAAVVARLPFDTLIDLAQAHGTDRFGRHFATRCARPEARRALGLRALASPEPTVVLRALREDPSLLPDLDIECWSARARHESEAHRVLAVLAQRSSPQALVALARRLGPERWRDTVSQAVPLLPGRSRHRATLELAAAVGPRLASLVFAASAECRRDAHTGGRLDHLYHRYEIPKDNGGVRAIAAPARWLRVLQRGLLRALLDPLGAHDAAHGFVRGRSIVTNAAPHVGREVVVNCDVRNCFPSVRWPWVLGALRRDLSARLSPGAVSLLLDVVTFEGALPVGAPTSPALLNRVLLLTDTRLAAAAAKRDCRYTRYADDLTFSGDRRAVDLLVLTRHALARLGLTLDERKTGVFRRGRRQMVTGLSVNDRVSVPRRLRRRLRAAVHALQTGGTPHWNGQPDTSQALDGRLAFVRAIHPDEGARLLAHLHGARS